MLTLRQAPVSYQPLQSPQSKIAAPWVWSNRLLLHTTFLGVLNNAPRARLLRTILFLKSTLGVQVRFSSPQGVSGFTSAGNGLSKVISKIFAPTSVGLSTAFIW